MKLKKNRSMLGIDVLLYNAGDIGFSDVRGAASHSYVSVLARSRQGGEHVSLSSTGTLSLRFAKR